MLIKYSYNNNMYILTKYNRFYTFRIYDYTLLVMYFRLNTFGYMLLDYIFYIERVRIEQ